MFTAMAMPQKKIKSKTIFNDTIVQYELYNGYVKLPKLDSLDNVIQGSGKISFMIVFQDSLGKMIYSKKIKLNYDSLNINETYIRNYIKNKFKLE